MCMDQNTWVWCGHVYQGCMSCQASVPGQAAAASKDPHILLWWVSARWAAPQPTVDPHPVLHMLDCITHKSTVVDCRHVQQKKEADSHHQLQMVTSNQSQTTRVPLRLDTTPVSRCARSNCAWMECRTRRHLGASYTAQCRHARLCCRRTHQGKAVAIP